MKTLILACIAGFTGLSHASNFCQSELTNRQKMRLFRLASHGVEVRYLSKVVGGKLRTVVVAPMEDPTKSVFSKVLSEDAGEAFDQKGLVTASPSQRINMLRAIQKFFAGLGDRVTARINLARLNTKNPAKLDSVQLRERMIQKFRWEYTLRSAYGKEMMNRELAALEKVGGTFKVHLGATSDLIPASLLRAELQNRLSDFRDLEVGTPMGKLAGLQAAGFTLSAASFLMYSPNHLLGLPILVFLPVAAYLGHELLGLVVDIKAERNPKLRRYAYYKKLFPLSGMRERDLNMNAIASIDDTFKSTEEDKYLLVVNPLRAERLIKTFMNNGYQEESLDPIVMP